MSVTREVGLCSFGKVWGESQAEVKILGVRIEVWMRCVFTTADKQTLFLYHTVHHPVYVITGIKTFIKKT